MIRSARATRGFISRSTAMRARKFHPVFLRVAVEGGPAGVAHADRF
jgi:hypothetical protein